jgi:DNA-binding response OmpR family regulator
MRPPKILVVDDDPKYVRMISINLEGSGYGVVTASDGVQALEIAAQSECDLILLDISLPKMDGYEVCREIRRFSDTPIIMLTAYNQTQKIVKGLDVGADDYVPKPFSAQELLARIRARLRRTATAPQERQTVYEFEELRLDTVRQRLFVREEEIHLTLTEYQLLTEFVSNAGRVLVTSYLLDAIWGSEAIDAHLLWQAIHRLRHKIERDPANPAFILTRPGIGYIFAAKKKEEE